MPKQYEYKIWKGTASAYKLLHAHIAKRFGKPRLCENCGDTEAKLYDWANISGLYLEIREDWERLCRKCHMHKDGRAFSKPATGMKHTEETKQRIGASVRRYRWGQQEVPV